MTIDKTRYKVWTWKHPLILHWMINPGLAINDFFLGQRVPEVTLIEKNSAKPLAGKSYIPCPHCGTIHPALKWSIQNKTAFGNWFGLYCDSCGGIIPCVRNLISLLLLAATFPVWIWFVKSWKRKWLQIQKEKFSRTLDLDSPQFNWLSEGLSFGFFMFLVMELAFPLFEGGDYTARRLLTGIVTWIFAGFLWGFIVKKLNFYRSAKVFQDRKS